MRILIFTQGFPPLIGGAGMQARLLGEGMTELGHEVTVVTESPGIDDPRWRFRLERQFTPYSFFRLARRSDAVLVIGASLRAILPAFAARRSVVVSHVMFPGKRPLERLKIIVCRAATNVVVSQAVARALSIPSIVIPNPYDDTIFHTETVRTRDRELAFVGRVIPEKGHALLVDALAVLRQRGSRLRLTVMGDGPELASIRSKVASGDLADQVIFLGAMTPPSIAEELRRHKVLVVPSVWEEPFGIVALEGIGCGCIPVVARSGGLPEAIGQCGIIYTKNSPVELADALHQSITDGEIKRNFYIHASRHVAGHRSVAIAEKYVIAMQSDSASPMNAKFLT